MSDRIFYVLATLCVALMIGFALVWPDRPGRGDPAPTPPAAEAAR